MNKKLLVILLISGFICLINPGKKEVNKVTATNETVMDSVELLPGESIDTSKVFYDDFSSNRLDNNWYVSNRKWGTFENYGVAADNVFLDDTHDKVVIRALGNQHIETSRIDNIGGPISGGALIMKQSAHPGRYEVRMKVAYKVGVCSAFWTYTEDSSAKNHEIDIELPPKSMDGDGKNVFDEVLFTNYIGETNYEQKASKLAYNLNDGEYHDYAFDWYYSNNHKLINYYVDGVLLATNSNVSKVPYLPTRLWLGAWIPNNPNFVGLPNFDKCYMEIDYVKYSPFTNQDAKTLGEAGGFGQSSLNYHVVNDLPLYDWLSNGEFNAIAKNDSITARGYSSTGTIRLENGYDHENKATSGGVKLSENSSITYTVDSVSKGQKFKLSTFYKGSGSIYISYLDRNNALVNNDNIELTNSEDWIKKEQSLEIPENTFTLKVRISTTTSQLYLDDLFLFLDEGDNPIDPSDPVDPTDPAIDPTDPAEDPISPTPEGEGEKKNIQPVVYVLMGAVPTAAVFSIIILLILLKKRK